jgi:molybdate transport system substrate-binding protein
MLLCGTFAPAHAADLTVSAAASLSDAFRALGPVFEARNAGIRVAFNFAASDVLLQQIAKGAPVDVLASADQRSMDQAEERKLIVPESRRNFAGNTLVLIAPAGIPLRIDSLADLQQPGIRQLAMGSPGAVPAGRYAQGALEAAGLWPALQPRLVFGQSVRQCLEYVLRGEVQAGFVYATDAALAGGRVKILLTVPTQPVVTYPIARVAASTNPDAGSRFIAFILSEPAQAVLARYGFTKP